MWSIILIISVYGLWNRYLEYKTTEKLRWGNVEGMYLGGIAAELVLFALAAVTIVLSYAIGFEIYRWYQNKKNEL